MRIGAPAAAGIGAAVVFTLGWVVADAASAEVDATRNTINDLGAAPLEDGWLWNVPRAASGVLVVAVCSGLRRRLPRTRGATWGVVLLALLGVADVLALVFRRDCLSSSAACGSERSYSWQHLGHELISPLGSVGLVLALVLLARCFRDEPRFRHLWRPTVATLALFVASLLLFALLRGDDGVGAVQRASVTVVYVWLAVVAVGVDSPARAGACVETTQAPPPVRRPRRRLRRGGRGT